MEISDDSQETADVYSSSYSENDDAVTLSSSNEMPSTVSYETSQSYPAQSQSDATGSEVSSSPSSESQSQAQAMDNEPLEGQVFEVPLVNVVQEAIIMARSQEDSQPRAPLNRSYRETTPLSCSPSDDIIKPLKGSNKKRKR